MSLAQIAQAYHGDIETNPDGVADATIQYVVDVLVNEFATGA